MKTRKLNISDRDLNKCFALSLSGFDGILAMLLRENKDVQTNICDRALCEYCPYHINTICYKKILIDLMMRMLDATGGSGYDSLYGKGKRAKNFTDKEVRDAIDLLLKAASPSATEIDIVSAEVPNKESV